MRKAAKNRTGDGKKCIRLSILRVFLHVAIIASVGCGGHALPKTSEERPVAAEQVGEVDGIRLVNADREP
jgi:hypothetical protein